MALYRKLTPTVGVERYTPASTAALIVLIDSSNFIPATETRAALVYSKETGTWLPLTNGDWVLLTENGIVIIDNDRFVIEYAAV